MFDRVLRSSFDSNLNDSRWWNGEPIWIHAEKSHKKTLVDWAGSMISFDGVVPTFRSSNTTMRDILKYFDVSTDLHPQFVAVHLLQLRIAMEKSGMTSQEAKDSLYLIDGQIGELIQGLSDRNVTANTDIIIVSDSGMYPVLSRVNLDEIVENIVEKTIIYENIPEKSDFYSSHVNLEVKNQEDISPILKDLQASQKLICHRGNDIPSRLNIGNSTRIGDIHCRSIPGTIISLNQSNFQPILATSGYDNRNYEMQSTFIAYGSLFKKNFKLDRFKNVDVFNILAYLLDLEYTTNNSGLETIQNIVEMY